MTPSAVLPRIAVTLRTLVPLIAADADVRNIRGTDPGAVV